METIEIIYLSVTQKNLGIVNHYIDVESTTNVILKIPHFYINVSLMR